MIETQRNELLKLIDENIHLTLNCIRLAKSNLNQALKSTTSYAQAIVVSSRQSILCGQAELVDLIAFRKQILQTLNNSH